MKTAALLGLAGLLLAQPLPAQSDSNPPVTDAASVPTPTPAPTSSGDWKQAIGPWSWQFPQDHGAHPDFKTEWWYFTGNLKDSMGRKFGYQLTIFRQGVQFTPAQPDSKWAVRDFYFGHLTISDIATGKFRVAERVTRGAMGEAAAATDRMDVTLGPWKIQQAGHGQIQLKAAEDDLAIDLTARPRTKPVLEGIDGLSRKAEGVGNASYYYSYPLLETSGQIRVGEMTYSVTGQSWFDHEFSSSLLGRNQVGWDWFCLQLDNHQEIMLYAMRDKTGGMDPVSEGTLIKEDGTAFRLEPGSFIIEKTGLWKSPKSGATYPAGWRISIPGHQTDLVVTPAMSDQELHLTKMGVLDYWEGATQIQGKVGAMLVTGVGYTELTGYGQALKTEPKIEAKPETVP